MPDVLHPTATPPLPADHATDPPRSREAIMAEVRALGERIQNPATTPEQKRAAQLRILLELMPELGQHETEEDAEKDIEAMRGTDSHRPPGHKLFEHILAEEGS